MTPRAPHFTRYVRRTGAPTPCGVPNVPNVPNERMMVGDYIPHTPCNPAACAAGLAQPAIPWHFWVPLSVTTSTERDHG